MARLAVTAGLIATLIGSSVAAEQPRPAQADRRECDAALSTVKAFTAKQINEVPWVVEASPIHHDAGSFSGGEKGLLTQQWQGKRPSRDLVRAFLASKPRSALSSCPAVRAYLDSRGITHGDKAAERAAMGDGSGPPLALYHATILTMSLPVISSTGDEAVVEISISGGPTAGAGSIHYLHRSPGGGWHDVGSLITGIA